MPADILLGPVVKKVVDLLGDMALWLTKKDRDRAAAYRAYKALVRMEKLLQEWEGLLPKLIKRPPELVDPKAMMRRLDELLDEWRSALKELDQAFGAIEVKLGIFGDLAKAETLGQAVIAENLWVSMADERRPRESKKLLKDVRECRKFIAKFVRDHYTPDQREDGR